MGGHKLEVDVEIKASAKDYHDLLCYKPHHISNASGDKIKGCELHEGDWGTVGSIIYWTYVHDGKTKTAKQVVEAVDLEKNLISFKVIEGDMMEEYKSFVFTLQATPKTNDEGCICHWVLEYEKLHEGIDHPETMLQLLVSMSKDMDAHLIKGN